MRREQGHIVVADFREGKHLDFITHCFENVLVQGLHAQNKWSDPMAPKEDWFDCYRLFLTLAAPGIDRIEAAIEQFGGVVVR